MTIKYDYCYTYFMKTAISIPNQIFEAADELAHDLGISRSELFTKAMEEYLRERENDRITNRLNEVYTNEDSKLDVQIKYLQIKSLKLDTNEW